MTPTRVPCFVCGEALTQAIPDHEGNQPAFAVAFEARGHYGSGVWDPMPGDGALEINVCDECLLDGATNGRVLRRRSKLVEVDEEYERWPDGS